MARRTVAGRCAAVIWLLAGCAEPSREPQAAPARPAPPTEQRAALPLTADDGSPVTPPSAHPDAPCAFPPAADANKIDGAAVVIRVLVRASGTAELVQTVEEPGFGFGEEATRCAMSWRYTPATDARGETVRAWTPPFRVRFVR